MGEVIFRKHSSGNGVVVGEITLNSEKHLNALTLGMVDAIYSNLIKWQSDNVDIIVLNGSGGKAFCAGGDVVSVRQIIEAKGANVAEKFFLHEFALDFLMHNYHKPIICWGSGIVMGGGMGLMNACRFRVATENSKLAMPETAIGYYPDVGGSYFLNRVPAPYGLFLGISGAVINAFDAKDLNLVDFILPSESMEKLLEHLCSISRKNSDIELEIKEILNNFQITNLQDIQKTGKLRPYKNLIKQAMDYRSTRDIFNALLNLEPEDVWLERVKKNLSYGSPFSISVVHQQLTLTKEMSLLDIFKTEMIMTANFLRHPDFVEGVRARLVDKDNKPNWRQKKLDEVAADEVKDVFVAPWAENPFEKLLERKSWHT